MNHSPLRYPGGKNKIAPFISLLIKKSQIQNPIYVEPFAGGAGVALSLLYNEQVDEIVINDYDKAIYSIWKAILTNTNEFINFIETVPLNITEWYKQKDIYINNSKKYSLELAFAAFYLNRTNRSGILKAGPIGGYEQQGNYLIDARFNRENLAERIRKISKYKSQIHLYNKDVRSFVDNYLGQYEERAFVYFDPPYFNKGKELYKNYFTYKDHYEIAQLIAELDCKWIVTYDNVKEIVDLYDQHVCRYFDLNYSVANKGKKSEVMFLSDEAMYPTDEELSTHKISINIREVLNSDN